MSILVFTLVVVVILALALWAIQTAPIPAPLNWIIQLLAIVIAIVLIANRAGVF